MPALLISSPPELDFLAAFGVEPVESRPSDGYWAYAFDGPVKSHLRFSFNTHEGSVQVTYVVGDERVAMFVSEGVGSIQICEDSYIQVLFTEDASTCLTIRIFPVVVMEWVSLRRNVST